MITARKITTWVLALGVLLVLCALAIDKPSGAASVTPILVEGNPTCSGPETPNSPDLGYANGFKPQPEPPPSGTYSFPGDPDNSVTITSDGTVFSWTSTLGIDAVIVKGGPNGNAYVYDPPTESFGETGLKPPLNDGGQQAGISHIEFCYDYEVKVTKTAHTSVDRTYTWTIDKSEKNNTKELTLQPGQSSTLNYEVTLTSSPVDSNHAVEGVITIKNPDPGNAATVTGVTDQITGGINADVTCDGKPFPITIPAGGTLECNYSAALPDGSDRTNTATVTTSGAVGGGSGTAPVSFANATVNHETDEIADVEDSFKGSLGKAYANDPQTKMFTYTRTVSFDKCGKYDVPNTASFTTNDTQTTGKDSWNVAVTVLCKVNVEKTVSGKAPSGTQQAFTFQLRTGASTTKSGTIVDSQVANAANGGMINFSGLVPGDTYQLCEIVMPGWSTSLGTFVPASFMPPDGIAPDPNVDNSILCVNFTAQGQTFKVDNTPPPGGRALTIGFWKNWASCSGGKQKPVLDQTLAKAEPTGEVISATSGTYPAFGPTLYLVLHGSTAKPDTAPDCQNAVRLLNKSTIDKGTKMASDPAFNLAAQLLAAELNYTAGAGKTGTATNAIQQAVLLLGKYKFGGKTHTTISAADATTMNNLAKILDDYNNDR